MKKVLSFDDVLLSPQFSYKRSRKEVSLSSTFLGMPLDSPIIAANMDTICSAPMAASMAVNGAVGALHRFCTIEENVQMYYDAKDAIHNNVTKAPHAYVIGSVGIGELELDRAKALVKAGCKHILIDVAHGAGIHVVEQYDLLRRSLDDSVYIIVGNFATADGIKAFNVESVSERKPDAFKVGVGGGSNCSTRIVTGCGWPTLASVLDCATTGYPIIADGGIKESGDIVKCLAAGASMVMIGSLLAGTDETPGEVIKKISWESQLLDYWNAWTEEQNIENAKALRQWKWFPTIKKYKKYRGSASAESYEVQGKAATHRAPEGVSRMVAYKGPVKDVLDTLHGGVRSGMTYLNATTLTDLTTCDMVEISSSGMAESRPHGLNNGKT